MESLASSRELTYLWSVLSLPHPYTLSILNCSSSSFIITTIFHEYLAFSKGTQPKHHNFIIKSLISLYSLFGLFFPLVLFLM